MDLDGNLSSIEDVEMMMQQPFFDTTSWDSALTSILPKSLVENRLSFLSPVLRRILFSVANNFAGLGAFPTEYIIPYLQKEGDAKHYQVIRSAHGYSSRMMNQTLFKAAIEAGSAFIVDLLLRQRPATIDVNKQVCHVGGSRYRPIDRAAELQNFHVVEILLDHGAHVTEPSEKPDSEIEFCTCRSCDGTLDCAVVGLALDSYVLTGPSIRLDHRCRIFKRLLDAGGDLTQRRLEDLIKSGDGELAAMVVSANASKKTAIWCKSGLLRDAITFLDDQFSIAIIKTTVEYGADLDVDFYFNEPYCYVSNCSLRYLERPGRPGRRDVGRAIEAAALYGKLEVTTLLLDLGAQMTCNTLPFAVNSGNEDLITMLLDKGANVTGIGPFKIPPLAAAIRTQNARTINMLEARGASILMHDIEDCCAILKAAAEVGNIPVVERLIKFESRFDSLDLGIALGIAVENGQDEIAMILIESGANVNVRRRNKGGFLNEGGFLSEAIRNRREDLVLMMLDAGINPNAAIDGQIPPLTYAVEWGQTSVIKALILAGGDANAGYGDSAFVTAVRQQNFTLVELLLDAGADINGRSIGRTALSAAVEQGDSRMACYLLDYGADPHDSLAFEKAMSQERGLLDLLLQRHNLRYPKGRPGFGSSALVHAIMKGDEYSVKMMLAKRIDIHSMIKFRDQSYTCYTELLVTPFWHTIVEKRHSIIEMLLAAGCGPEEIVCQVMRHYDGDTIPRTTAFVTAIGTLDIPIIKLFIRHKANVNFPARGRVTRTPLQKAAELGDLPVLELLLNHGADVNAPAAYNGGGTALQLAAIGGYFPVVCKLLALKADANAPGAKVYGRSALQGAAEHGRLDMVQLLLNAGAGTGESGTRQVERAIWFADANGHFPICDLLRDHFHLGE